MSDTIVLPRAVAEALVDPTATPYIHEGGWCNYCDAPLVYRIWGQETPGDHVTHGVDCPVRITQEALAQPQIACDEHGEPLAAIYRDYESTPELEAMIASLSTAERMLVEVRSRASRMTTIEHLVRTVIGERRH